MNVLRQQIIQQAVRLLAEGTEVDYFSAKTKAAKMFGYSGQHDLPANGEIEAELKKYQAIFHAKSQPLIIEEKRRTALSTMRCFAQFKPCLVGSVLAGTATENSPIEIHLFVESFKELALFLLNKQIPYELIDRTLRINKRESKTIPVMYFSAGDQAVEMSIFPAKDIRQKYLNPASGLMEVRATLKKVTQLLAQNGA
ncbi:MAG TPA: hypothetical protein ENK06_03640 [Gammaproteobacteria bacterium]|nr:hypothetical protein [Gammaproteobacteria bacterium]